MKLPSFLPRRKSRFPEPNDQLDYNRLPVMSAEQLIAYTGQYNRLRNIKRIVRIDDDTYQILYQDTLERFFELVQLMPASQAHHHAVPAGLMIHTLEVIEHALTLRQQYKLPQFAAQEVQEAERHVWTFAIFIAALLHDVGKRITMCRFILENGKELEPFTDVMKHAGAHYRLAFVDTKYYAMHEEMGLAFAAYLLGPIGLNFLLPRLHIMEEILAYIHEDKNKEGIISHILKEADKKSTGGSLAHSSSRRFKGANLLNIGERLMTQLRQLLAANHFVINRSNGNVYTTQTGYTYIISKTLADELRNTMREQGETDIPGDNLRIFDILQEYGFVETNADGQSIHYIRRSYQGKSDTFSVLKFRSSKLFQVQPPEFPGQIVELAGKPDKGQHTENSYAHAAKSLPATVDDDNPLPEAVHDMFNRSGTGDEASSVRPNIGVQRKQHVNTSIDAPDADAETQQESLERAMPNEGAQITHSAPADQEAVMPIMDDDPFATTAPLASDNVEIIDDVPVFKMVDEPDKSVQDTGAEKADKLYQQANETLDIASAFLDWCRERVRSKKAIINESSGMIQKVRFGDKSVVAVVTPRVFAEFGQEVLGLSLEASREKSNIQKIQSEIHKQKVNIPAKRGHVHFYRIKRSESGGFNQAIKLSHYLFTIDNFAGVDHEIREIIEKTKDNTNLEKM